MNTHSLACAIRTFLLDVAPDMTVHLPVNNAELHEPYILLNLTADNELVAGNHTWECTLSVEVHTEAHDQLPLESRRLMNKVCGILSAKSTKKQLNDAALDFFLYALSLRSVNEPQAQENTFTQTADFRIVVQF